MNHTDSSVDLKQQISNRFDLMNQQKHQALVLLTGHETRRYGWDADIFTHNILVGELGQVVGGIPIGTLLPVWRFLWRHRRSKIWDEEVHTGDRRKRRRKGWRLWSGDSLPEYCSGIETEVISGSGGYSRFRWLDFFLQSPVVVMSVKNLGEIGVGGIFYLMI